MENLNSKILYVVHDACHHVASVGIKQEDRRLSATGRRFIIWLQDQKHPHLHHTFVNDPSPFLACIQVSRRESWEFPRLDLAPGFPLKTTKGHKKSPDAVTVLTATVTCNVADNEVRPLTVLAPDWEIVLPGDMLKKISVWSMLMTKRMQQFIAVTLGLANDKTHAANDCSYLGFGKVNEVNRLSAQNLKRTLAFMRFLPEHNLYSYCRSTARQDLLLSPFFFEKLRMPSELTIVPIP